MPAVSVLMPVFNGQAYVEQAVRSVLSQTFEDFDLLIVDDGSTDGTLALLQRLAATDHRIRLFSRPNVGLVATLNELLERSTSDIVARMDADDVCRPARFERQYSYLKEQPDCVVVGTRFRFIDPAGWPLYEFPSPTSHEQVDAVLLQPDIGLLHPSVMMRRAAVLAVGGYTSQYPHVEDLDLFLRLGEVGRLANLTDVLMDYRVHVSSVTHTYCLDQHIAGLKAVRDACLRRGIAFHRNRDIEQPSFAFQTRVAMHRKWAWCALGAGNVRSARKHALLAMTLAPLDGDNVRLLACALRGH